MSLKNVSEEWFFWPIEWLSNICLFLYSSLWDFAGTSCLERRGEESFIPALIYI